MRIVIVGAGNAGCLLAERLRGDRFSVVMIDERVEALALAAERFDVMTVPGSGADPLVLEAAEADKADLLVAITDREQVNILACLFAHAAGVPRTIARVSSPQYQMGGGRYDLEKMGLDLVINQKTACANEICRALALPGAIESFDLFEGLAMVAGFTVSTASPIIGATPATLPDRDLLDRLRIIALSRAGSLIIPRGNTVFEAGDAIHLVGAPEDIRLFSSWMNPRQTPFVKVIIAGGGDMGLSAAKTLERQGVEVVLLEQDEVRAAQCADALKHALVLRGDALSGSVLDETGIVPRTAFVAVTGDDENNVMNCLMARKKGVDYTITQIGRTDYLPVIESLGLVDRTISPFESITRGILHYLRSRNVRAAALLHNLPGELLDVQVSSRNKYVGQAVQDIRFPRESIVAVVLRGREVIPATGQLRLCGDDRLLIFSDPVSVHRIHDMFRK